MKSVLIRVIISLFLCCCIVLNVFSLPASATSVAVVAGLAAIPTAVAVACAMQALGVMSASNSSGFTTTVDNCSNWLTQNTDLVVNGTVALLGLTQSGLTTSYLSKNFVQTVWEWLYSSGPLRSLSYVTTVSNIYGKNYSYRSQGAFTAIAFRAIDKYGNACLNFAIRSTSGAQIDVYNTSGTLYDRYYFDLQIGGYYYSNLSYSGSDVSFSSLGYNMTYLGDLYVDGNNVTNVKSNIALLHGSSSVLTTTNVQIGQTQTPYQEVGTEEETIQIEIAPIYIDWTKYGVPDPNDPGGDDPDNDGKFPMWLPTGIPSPGYDDSVITQNQQQAQSGAVSGDITFEPYEPSNPGSGNGSGNTGTNTGTNFLESLTQFFTPSGDITMYSLDLKELFPFCIPFDIYNFLAALSADPVPPVFEFDLNLGVATEPMKIDLSNWSDLAAIIRTLELGLFCVGLALKTRELIGG